MGHTTSNQVQRCRNRCPRSTRTALVLAVRNPYEYWQSVFKYTWDGKSIIAHRKFRDRGIGMEAMRAGALHSFTGFMQWAEKNGWQYTQTFRLARSCGSPCHYDFLLRTETLAHDWQRLVTNFSLPHVALPHINEGHASSSASTPPNHELTPEAIRIVNKLDSHIFATFGYTMRQSDPSIR